MIEAADLNAGDQILRAIGPGLEADPYFQHDLAQLKEYAGAVNEQMRRMDLGPLCVECASQASGGCCSLYMSGEVDGVQVSLNRLAGLEVRVVREDGTNCVFLGSEGCIFLFKPMFCLNYLCNRIRVSATPENLTELEGLTGRLLGKQFELEQLILNRLRSVQAA